MAFEALNDKLRDQSIQFQINGAYAKQLIDAGAITQEQADLMVQSRMQQLERAYAEVKPERDFVAPVPEVPPSGAAKKAKTAVSLDTLQSINAQAEPAPRP